MPHMASQKRQIMSDYSSLVWEWNAKRQAINPNHVSDPQIEYLTPKGERKTLAYADLVDTVYRTPMRPDVYKRQGKKRYQIMKDGDSFGIDFALSEARKTIGRIINNNRFTIH